MQIEFQNRADFRFRDFVNACENLYYINYFGIAEIKIEDVLIFTKD